MNELIWAILTLKTTVVRKEQTGRKRLQELTQRLQQKPRLKLVQGKQGRFKWQNI